LGEDDRQEEEEVEVGEVVEVAERPSAVVEVGEVAKFLRPAMALRPPRIHDARLPCQMVCPD
jgi:hypothetical protein